MYQQSQGVSSSLIHLRSSHSFLESRGLVFRKSQPLVRQQKRALITCAANKQTSVISNLRLTISAGTIPGKSDAATNSKSFDTLSQNCFTFRFETRTREICFCRFAFRAESFLKEFTYFLVCRILRACVEIFI